jgi:diguanylate cyclase (GGDEF)-like protein
MDGYHRWMSARGIAERDATGRPRWIAGSQTDITTLRMAQGQVLRDALHHEITGLPNRTFFLGALARHIEQQQGHRRCAVLVVDVDEFTRLNESQGRRRGDELLVGMAERVKTVLRPGDSVAHLGSDEFALLVEGVEHEEEVERIARRVHGELASPFPLSGQNGIFVTAAVGIRIARPGDSAEALLADAETAMRAARSTGRGRTARFEDSMRVRAVEVSRLETELKVGLEREEFRIFYQPIVSIPDCRIQAVEALVRWEHPSRGLLEPGAFLDVAEESGLLVDIGRWLVDGACRQLAEWRASAAGAGLALAVNLSDNQFADVGAVRHLVSCLERYDLGPELLTVELTENVLLDGPAWAEDRMAELRAHRIAVSMDDFGTGYSSLSYLYRYRADALKIDRSFVAGLGRDAESLSFVRAILELAKSLGLAVVAEGVETEAHLSLLSSLGCERAQGFLFGRPMPAEALTRALLPNFTPVT